MKISSTSIALVISAGYPVLALAQLAGAPLPASLTSAAALGLYVAALIGLTLVRDYKVRQPATPRLRRVVALHPVSVAESHRLAA